MTKAHEFQTSEQTHLSELGIRALAALVAADIRPEWDTAGIVRKLHQVAHTAAADALAIAFIRGAKDPRNQTPAFIRYPNNRAWNDKQPCPEHPKAGRRPDGECAGHWADRIAADPEEGS